MNLIDIVLHLDVYLSQIINLFGIWTYVILFLIIFIETGIVVFPFLPGDSLLFIIGSLAAAGATISLGTNFIWVVSIVLMLAAILGNTANYFIGKAIGPKIFSKEETRFFNKKNLMRAHAMYEKFGGKIIIISRFIPFVRDFAPFVAGIGTMGYGWFLLYNIIGGVSWVIVGIGAGYLFGNIPFIKDNFSLVILTVVFLSCIPIAIMYFYGKAKNNRLQPKNS
jgi:Uncharacterized membrane-associated protein